MNADLDGEDPGWLIVEDGFTADEFHEHIDNSAYTNYLVRWHLQQAARVYGDLALTHPGELASLSERIGLTSDEVEAWLCRAEQIRLPR